MKKYVKWLPLLLLILGASLFFYPLLEYIPTPTDKIELQQKPITLKISKGFSRFLLMPFHPAFRKSAQDNIKQLDELFRPTHTSKTYKKQIKRLISQTKAYEKQLKIFTKLLYSKDCIPPYPQFHESTYGKRHYTPFLAGLKGLGILTSLWTLNNHPEKASQDLVKALKRLDFYFSSCDNSIVGFIDLYRGRQILLDYLTFPSQHTDLTHASAQRIQSYLKRRIKNEYLPNPLFIRAIQKEYKLHRMALEQFLRSETFRTEKHYWPFWDAQLTQLRLKRYFQNLLQMSRAHTLPKRHSPMTSAHNPYLQYNGHGASLLSELININYINFTTTYRIKRCLIQKRSQRILGYLNDRKKGLKGQKVGALRENNICENQRGQRETLPKLLDLSQLKR